MTQGLAGLSYNYQGYQGYLSGLAGLSIRVIRAIRVIPGGGVCFLPPVPPLLLARPIKKDKRTHGIISTLSRVIKTDFRTIYIYTGM